MDIQNTHQNQSKLINPPKSVLMELKKNENAHGKQWVVWFINNLLRWLKTETIRFYIVLPIKRFRILKLHMVSCDILKIHYMCIYICTCRYFIVYTNSQCNKSSFGSFDEASFKFTDLSSKDSFWSNYQSYMHKYH